MATIDDLISEIERSYDDLTAQLADPEVLGDRARYADVARAHAELVPVHELTQLYREAERTVADAEGLLGDDSSDAEMREFAQDELIDGRKRLDELAEEIRVRMLTRDPNDDKNVIIEIRAGTGGDEACIFAGELCAHVHALRRGARGSRSRCCRSTRTTTAASRRSRSRSRARARTRKLKYEGGVHRVQRVPVTEAAGRIHTSTATVAVLPEAEDVEVEIQPNDLRVDVFRARGPGGQSVNTTDSAVRITHTARPASSSAARTRRASSRTRRRRCGSCARGSSSSSRPSRTQERGDARRSMVGSGDRSQKIRTYNFPQNRVTDHRIGLTSHRIDGVMEGELDEFTDALAAEDRRAATGGRRRGVTRRARRRRDGLRALSRVLIQTSRRPV